MQPLDCLALVVQLRTHDWQIGLYTTSHRKPKYIKKLFNITHMGRKPTTNNETKDSNNSGLKWAPQALRPLVSCILSLVSYKPHCSLKIGPHQFQI